MRRSFSVSSSCFFNQHLLFFLDSPVCMNKSVKQPKACQQFVKQLKLSSSPPTVQGVSPLCLIVKVKYFKHTHLSQGLFLETISPSDDTEQFSGPVSIISHCS